MSFGSGEAQQCLSKHHHLLLPTSFFFSSLHPPLNSPPTYPFFHLILLEPLFFLHLRFYLFVPFPFPPDFTLRIDRTFERLSHVGVQGALCGFNNSWMVRVKGMVKMMMSIECIQSPGWSAWIYAHNVDWVCMCLCLECVFLCAYYIPAMLFYYPDSHPWTLILSVLIIIVIISFICV